MNLPKINFRAHWILWSLGLLFVLWLVWVVWANSSLQCWLGGLKQKVGSRGDNTGPTTSGKNDCCDTPATAATCNNNSCGTE